jgi:hypothetical protein
MSLQLLLLVLLLAAVGFLYHRQGKLHRDVEELQASVDSYVALEDYLSDWETIIEPEIEALKEQQTTFRRHVSLLATSVRSLERHAEAREPGTTLDPSMERELQVEAKRLPSFLPEDAAGGRGYHDENSEGQLQAMLSSVATILGMKTDGPLAVRPLGGPGCPSQPVIVEETSSDFEEETATALECKAPPR